MNIALEPVRSINGWPAVGSAEQDLDFARSKASNMSNALSKSLRPAGTIFSPLDLFRRQRVRSDQFLATNVSITCRASAPSSDLENAIAPNFKSFPSEVRLNWKTYSATSSMRP
jgi:hypothetical protein